MPRLPQDTITPAERAMPKESILTNHCGPSVNTTRCSLAGSTTETTAPPVFKMTYERNPVRCKFERRLEVNTSPLNIIYNPQAIKKVTEFFYKGRVHTSGLYTAVVILIGQ